MLSRIVVIEDDVYMREELIDMLKKAGYDAVPFDMYPVFWIPRFKLNN